MGERGDLEGAAVRVLGVDPSVRRAGLVVLDMVRGRRPEWVVGVEVRQGGGDDAERLGLLARTVREVIEEYGATLVGVEDAYVGPVGGRSVVLVAAGAGACVGAAAACGVRVVLVSRARALRSVGSGSASKGAVAAVVRGLVAGAPTRISQHEADAAAVAMAAAAKIGD